MPRYKPKRGDRPPGSRPQADHQDNPNPKNANLIALGVRGAHHAFTMQDEARNTANHRDDTYRTTFGQDQNLRSRPVTFVSAGTTQPVQLLENEKKEEDTTKKSPSPAPLLTPPPAKARETAPASARETTPARARETTPARAKETAATTTSKEPTPAPSSPAPMAMSKRASKKCKKTPKSPQSQPYTTQPTVQPESDSSEEVILFKGRGRKSRSLKKKSGRIAKEDREEKKEEEKALIGDYIANMAMDIDEPEAEAGKTAFAKRDLGHEISVDVQEQSSCPEPSDKGEESASDHLDKSSESEREQVNEAFARLMKEESEESDTEGEEPYVMDDESLARLMVKQVELGIGGDELQLYDDSIGPNVSGPRGTNPRNARSQRTPNSNSFITVKGCYPSAGKLADAFEELENSIHDWGVPRKAGKKGQPLHFNAATPEMEEAMAMAWQKDRLRKKEKKQRREELRAQGELGNKATRPLKPVDPDSLDAKYPLCMTPLEIREELKLFLMGSAESIAFPPMEPYGRKIIHLYANKLKLKSKSDGEDKDRHNVLYRTDNTVSFDEDFFQAALAAPRVRFKAFYRPTSGSAAKGKAATRGSKGKVIRSKPAPAAGLSYREGDVVGATAPQITRSNKGRSMLEKMGWSHGTGLGTEENKGITEPVTQVVKRTKTGLGLIGEDNFNHSTAVQQRTGGLVRKIPQD